MHADLRRWKIQGQPENEPSRHKSRKFLQKTEITKSQLKQNRKNISEQICGVANGQSIGSKMENQRRLINIRSSLRGHPGADDFLVSIFGAANLFTTPASDESL